MKRNNIKDAEVVSTPDNTAQAERRKKEQEVAKKIESVLVEYGLALQPYIAYSEYGIVPRVRLVENNNETNGQGNSEEQTEGAGDADTITEPVEA